MQMVKSVLSPGFLAFSPTTLMPTAADLCSDPGGGRGGEDALDDVR